MRVFNVGNLIRIIKAQLKIKEGITIHSGSETLEDRKLVIELYNTKDDAFEIQYQGTTLDTFYLKLKLFHDEWFKQPKTYTPYLTIIQSSGSGKTWLVGELRTRRIYILYICKLHEASSGYPASTPCIQQI